MEMATSQGFTLYATNASQGDYNTALKLYVQTKGVITQLQGGWLYTLTLQGEEIHLWDIILYITTLQEVAIQPWDLMQVMLLWWRL